MTKNTLELSPLVRSLLLRSGCSGNTLHLPDERLSRPDYEAVNKAIVLLGGKWVAGRKCHVFPPDVNAAEFLAKALKEGSIPDTKKEFQVFETPEAVADEMVRALALQPVPRGPHTVLEPSAGRGRLMDALIRSDIPHAATAFEIQQDLANRLTEQYKKAHIICGDFLKADPRRVPGIGAGFDAILMNPPFSKGQDVDHIRHAHQFLRHGGRMVAICSPSWTFNRTKKFNEFRAWAGSLGTLFSSRDLPEGTFKQSGTPIRTLMLTIGK
jgi:phospholipid N-methyltransferase